MENEDILQEEESSILSLTDENGEETQFEYLDCIEYEGKEYQAVYSGFSLQRAYDDQQLLPGPVQQ